MDIVITYMAQTPKLSRTFVSVHLIPKENEYLHTSSASNVKDFLEVDSAL
jgi:hypothetical protein